MHYILCVVLSILLQHHNFIKHSGYFFVMYLNFINTLYIYYIHPLRDREVVGSNPGCTIPKALKMVPVATLLGAQHYKASTGFSSPKTYRTINFATLAKINKSEKSPIIINVCIHRRTVWKTGSYAKYVILLKYRDYYYYYYYYYY